MEVGEVWAYRENVRAEFTPVKILAHGTNPRRKRTKVKFLDDQHEGIEEWYPTGRLWCPWKEVDEFKARQQRWDNLIEDDRPDLNEDFAACLLYEALTPGVADIYGANMTGISEIQDLPALLEMLGWPEERITDTPGYLLEDGNRYVRWSVTKQILQGLAHRSPARTYELVRELEVQHEVDKYEYEGRLAARYLDEAEAESLLVKAFGTGTDPAAAVMLNWLGEYEEHRWRQAERLQAQHTDLRNLAKQTIPYLQALKRGTTTRLSDEIIAFLDGKGAEEE